VELTGFTTAILSGVAAGIHLITIQIVINDGHVPACTAGDRTCAEGIGLIVVMYANPPEIYKQSKFCMLLVSPCQTIHLS
jgi:hypothetical protein